MRQLMIFVILVLLYNFAEAKWDSYQTQSPLVWDALRILRGGKDMTTVEIINILRTAVPGKDYPINAQIPPSTVQCSAERQPGYYVDAGPDSRCQAFHRCDENLNRTDYLCGNGTLFNQITLICDWFYNVDCVLSEKFTDYSNSRLNGDYVPFLDDLDYSLRAGRAGPDETQSAQLLDVSAVTEPIENPDAVTNSATPAEVSFASSQTPKSVVPLEKQHVSPPTNHQNVAENQADLSRRLPHPRTRKPSTIRVHSAVTSGPAQVTNPITTPPKPSLPHHPIRSASAHSVLQNIIVNPALDGKISLEEVPQVEEALRVLRGGANLTSQGIITLLRDAVPGKDYPNRTEIPYSDFNCSSRNQPGYYVDTSNRSLCQLFYRCTDVGIRTDYLCPSGSLFNQITLVCDWFYNVQCSLSDQFTYYSNSRLNEQDVWFLGVKPGTVLANTGAVQFEDS